MALDHLLEDTVSQRSYIFRKEADNRKRDTSKSPADIVYLLKKGKWEWVFNKP